jgi:mannose-1-phosphate guanylyltransferase
MHQPQDDRWALILAGGDGIRLRPLTRVVAGDERPKQFSPLFGTETLLDQTRHRISSVVPPERISVVATRKHERFFSQPLREAPGPLIVQPENRGTAPAILYGVLSIRRRDPAAKIATFPSDHYFTNEVAFMTQVRAAFRIVEQRPELIVLLGIVPDSPAVDYAWIEPSDSVAQTPDTPLFRIHRFWERPSPALAEQLMARGCFWNSFVVVGSADALAALLQDTVPALYRSFEPVLPMLGTLEETDAVERVYLDLLPVDFCTEVLALSPQILAVLPVADTGWTDLADPKRTLSLIARDRVWTGGAGD